MRLYDDQGIDYFVNLAEHSESFTEEYDLLTEYTDERAYAGYKRLTGNEPRSYTLDISEPKRSRIKAIKGPHAIGGGKWSDHAISKAYKDPAVKKFWRKIDGKTAEDEYFTLINKVLQLEAWLTHREKYYTEEQLWNLSTYHQSLKALKLARWDIDRLVEEYDLPRIDIDMLIEETR